MEHRFALFLLIFGSLSAFVGSQTVLFFGCDDITKGRPNVIEATLDASPRNSCAFQPLTQASFKVEQTNGNVVSLCVLQLHKGCQEAAKLGSQCSCKSHEKDTYRFELQYTFDEAHRGGTLDLEPNCLPPGAFANRKKCENLKPKFDEVTKLTKAPRVRTTAIPERRPTAGPKVFSLQTTFSAMNASAESDESDSTYLMLGGVGAAGLVCGLALGTLIGVFCCKEGRRLRRGGPGTERDALPAQPPANSDLSTRSNVGAGPGGPPEDKKEDQSPENNAAATDEDDDAASGTSGASAATGASNEGSDTESEGPPDSNV